MKPKLKLIVEHLEPKLTEWLLLEYRHASKWWYPDLIFTNVKSGEDAEKLGQLGEVMRERFYEVVEESDKIVVLDPFGEKVLEPEDLKDASFVVIGGICGDVEFDGRTRKMVTAQALSCLRNVVVRNLGRVHFPIDQAAIIAKLVAEGRKLDEIEVREGMDIVLEESRGFKRVVHLPYGYVVINDRVQLADGFTEFLKKGWEL